MADTTDTTAIQAQLTRGDYRVYPMTTGDAVKVGDMTLTEKIAALEKRLTALEAYHTITTTAEAAATAEASEAKASNTGWSEEESDEGDTSSLSKVVGDYENGQI